MFFSERKVNKDGLMSLEYLLDFIPFHNNISIIYSPIIREYDEMEELYYSGTVTDFFRNLNNCADISDFIVNQISNENNKLVIYVDKLIRE